ncbi:glycosyltransferase family 52 [Methanobrevibacter sp.]|uniref:glycosyltransferase family 52 n=1 Tax=Methanobrevibacter sp. TaxID=66852 RepID=UPI00388E8A97
MSKSKKNICLVTTVYSFFLYLLIKGYDEDDIYIFTAWFPKEVSKNVDHIQMPPVSFKGKKFAELNSISGIWQNIIGFSRYFYGYLKLRVLLFIKTFNCDVEAYGHAQTPFSYILFENENSNIIEDGLENYSAEICEPHKINPFIDLFLHICGIYFLNNCECYGTHKNVKNVYLTNKHENPLIKDKVRVIDIDTLWNELSENEQSKILQIFNIDLNNMDFNKESVIILTQPLSEGQENITLDQELTIYKNMIEKFKDKSVIIKPHPRDLKNYSEIFPDVEVIDRFFPIELLNLIGIKPKVVCSIFSTALLNFKESELYVYEGDLYNPKFEGFRDDLINLINEKN